MSNFSGVYLCDEPKKKILRTVRPLELQDIPLVYESMRQSHEERGRELKPDVAVEELARLDKAYWVVDNVGLLIANAAGDVHVFFWDKRLRGREAMCRSIAEMAMEFFQRNFVWTEIPKKERAVLAFAQRIGFRVVSVSDETITLRLDREVH